MQKNRCLVISGFFCLESMSMWTKKGEVHVNTIKQDGYPAISVLDCCIRRHSKIKPLLLFGLESLRVTFPALPGFQCDKPPTQSQRTAAIDGPSSLIVDTIQVCHIDNTSDSS